MFPHSAPQPGSCNKTLRGMRQLCRDPGPVKDALNLSLHFVKYSIRGKRFKSDV